jgi:3-oxoacyl-[acyl-carrier protein] reductase
MTGRLRNKNAIVIGAAQGIGVAIVERFVEEGAFVTVGDIDAVGGRALVERLGAQAVQFQCVDVSNEDEVNELVSLSARHSDRLDVLVQNAGVYPLAMVEDLPKDVWDRNLSINLGGTFLAAKACLPRMRTQKGGRMIFTSSITGPRVANPGHSSYAASKAGINGFIKAAAVEFACHGITVNGVEPGNILTNGLTSSRSIAYIEAMRASIPLGRLGTPRDVANAILFLASEEASYITGTTILIDGGQTLPESKDFHVAT